MPENKAKNITQVEYYRVIDNLMHLMNFIRLEIAYDINKSYDAHTHMGVRSENLYFFFFLFIFLYHLKEYVKETLNYERTLILEW